MDLRAIQTMMSEIAPVVRDYVSREIARFTERLAVLEARGPERGEKGEPGIDGADGKDGIDGLGFDDLEMIHDGERTFTFAFTRGAERKEFTFQIPAMIYRGIFKDGRRYEWGDVVTWGGSAWHCNDPTSDKPGEGGTAWTLAVKEGRRGKDGKDGAQGAEGRPGTPGRDGRTWA